MKKYSCKMTSYCNMGAAVEKCKLTEASFEQLQAFMGTYLSPSQVDRPATHVVFEVTLPVEEKPKSEIVRVLEEIIGDAKQTSYVRQDAAYLKTEIEAAQKGRPVSEMRIRHLRNELLTKTRHLSAQQVQALYNFIVQ